MPRSSVSQCREMKRERTAEFAKWRRLVSQQIASGRTVAAFCRDRGLREWQFYEWKKRVRGAGAAKFVAVEVAVPSEAVVVTSGKAIEVRLPRGRSLVVEPGFDTQHLRALLSVLEAET